MVKITKEISYIPAGKVRAYAIDGKTTEATLAKLGINVSPRTVKELRSLARDFSMDSNPNLQTSGYMTPIQFLQHWMPEAIEVVTAAQEIDNIVGRTIAGSWYDEEIIQPIVETTGCAEVYGDSSDTPLSSYNVDFEHRTIVRFEEGVKSNVLEEYRASAMNVNSMSVKRDAAAKALAASMNEVGFFGFNAGHNKTYGLLNDPNLPAYQTPTVGEAGKTEWDSKSYAEITNDIRAVSAELRTQSGGNVKPERDAWVLTLPLSKVEYLNVENENGKSVFVWIKENYPNVRIESAVELDGANGGQDVLYAHAELINGKKVIDQIVPEVLRLVGVERKAKGFEEVYSNATAGVLVSQPIGVVRLSGI